METAPCPLRTGRRSVRNVGDLAQHDDDDGGNEADNYDGAVVTMMVITLTNDYNESAILKFSAISKIRFI